MSPSPDDSDIGPLVSDLVRTLQELEEEFEPRTESGLPRPPSPRELMRLTSDVGIPGVILLLRTNIEALKLLQRALRLAEGRPPTTGSGGSEVRQRAEQVSRTTLSRLDGALAGLQHAVEGRPGDADARELVDEARDLREDVEQKLADRTDGESPALDEAGEDESTVAGSEADEVVDESVPVDVDAELRSIKDEFDGGEDDSRGSNGDDANVGNGDNGTDNGSDGA